MCEKKSTEILEKEKRCFSISLLGRHYRNGEIEIVGKGNDENS
jgi:hypothetical protein